MEMDEAIVKSDDETFSSNDKDKTCTNMDISTNFVNWITGLRIFEKFYLGYLENLKFFKMYKKQIMKYSFFSFLVSAFSVVSIILLSLISKQQSPYQFGLNCILLVGIISNFIYCLYVYRNKISFGTNKLFRNLDYKNMKTISNIPITASINFNAFLLKLYLTTILCKLYPDKLKDLNKTDFYKEINKFPADEAPSIYSKFVETPDPIIKYYLRFRPSSHLLSMVIENPKIYMSIVYNQSRHNIDTFSSYEEMMTINKPIIEFFKSLVDNDNIECICEYSYYCEDMIDCLHSPFSAGAVMELYKANLPEFEERLKKESEIINSPFKMIYSLYENYKKIEMSTL